MGKKIKEVMTRDVEVVGPTCGIREATQLMKALDIGVLPVCDGNRLIGMVTDRDIALRVVADGLDVNQSSVKQAMSSPVVYCYEDQDVEEAGHLMEVKQIRRLLVLDRDKNLAGVVSLGDIVVKTGREDLAGEILERVSEPKKDHSAA